MVKQSSNDPKHYKAITLDNGLRVLLIHNNETSKSAAALAVNVGHFNDPRERQGLAHFLEHMLFLGTKNYPDGSEYQKYISQHGGHHNAWTGTEHTCFFFDIQAAQFTPALQRFSEFFIAPLLADEFVVKERENIDAEFTLKLKDDMRRLYDVHKDTVNPEHPFSQFSVGNLDTLADRSGQNISHEIHAFFTQFYRAQYMTLALEGPQKMSELQSLAKQLFAGVASTSMPLPAIKQPLYLNTDQKIKINVCPVKNDHQLIISFAMDSIDQYYRDKPESIIAYLLGHEGKGSILSVLKQHEWALALTAGSGINGSNFKDFNISIALTELGEKHINEIIDAVFCYINLLKEDGIAEYYYQEKQKISYLAFTYHEKMQPLDSVSQLVINMQHYPEEDYIFGDYVMSGMSKIHVKKLLDNLHVNNMRIIHVSQNNQFSQRSFWYQVPFHVTTINSEQLQSWQHAQTDKKTHTRGLHLPLPNPYIISEPEVYSVKNTEDKKLAGINVPQKIINKNGFSVWFKQDKTFNVPKGYLYIGIDSPHTVSSPANVAMTRLFVDLYTDTVIEENYDAELAGIHYHLYAHQGGVTLQLSGYSENQYLLLGKLLSRLQTQQVTEAHFNLFKRQLITYWQNNDKSKSISQLFANLSSVMQPNNPTSNALAECLSKVSFHEYQRFSQKIFKQVTLEVLIHGNWLPKHADKLCSTIEAAFHGQVNDKHHIRCPITDISNKQTLLIPLTLPEHDHACVIYNAMPGKDHITTALTIITSHILSPLFFQKMRTEKQYGYLVGVGYVPINRYPGIAFYIQSPHCDAYNLANAMDEFIENSLGMLGDIKEQEWLHLLKGLTGQLQEKDHNLRIKSQRFWAAICNKDDNFNDKEQLLKAMLELTLTEVKSFVSKRLIQASQPDRLILYSQTNDMDPSLIPSGVEVTDIEGFIASSIKKY